MKKTILIGLVLTLNIGLTPGVTRAKLVACVGDSITYGYGISNRNDNSYPAQLATILQSSDSEWETQNFGANGATLLRNGDQPYIRKGVYNPALASAPEVVIIILGTNDSWPSNWTHKDDFIPDYLALIDAFAELPSNPKIFICCPPPIWANQWGLNGTVLKSEIIPLIYDLSELRDVGVIDLHTPLENSRHLFPDGGHPNIEATGVIAETIAAAIIAAQKSPDFNGNGIVDIKDLERLIESWKQADPIVDIAPEPFGDGYIDTLDLELLMNHWEQPVNDPTLIAHWALDEVEGMFAADSVGDNDAIVLGGIEWQPNGGQVNGALKLDGVSGYAITAAILNPADGPFSIFAWIKGGAPGQVIVSQTNVSNWLYADPSEGKLITNLSSTPSRTPPPPLKSESVITNNEWHRIGLVWDGLKRMLYVDGVKVAENPQNGLMSSSNGLYIGCGMGMEPGSFFSGLIDDVRIYNRVIIP